MRDVEAWRRCRASVLSLALRLEVVPTADNLGPDYLHLLLHLHLGAGAGAVVIRGDTLC